MLGIVKIFILKILCSLFLIFNTVDGKKCCLYKRWGVPMNGFEPRTSSVRSNRSTHWAITTALGLKLFAANALIERILKHFLKGSLIFLMYLFSAFSFISLKIFSYLGAIFSRTNSFYKLNPSTVLITLYINSLFLLKHT